MVGVFSQSLEVLHIGPKRNIQNSIFWRKKFVFSIVKFVHFFSHERKGVDLIWIHVQQKMPSSASGFINNISFYISRPASREQGNLNINIKNNSLSVWRWICGSFMSAAAAVAWNVSNNIESLLLLLLLLGPGIAKAACFVQQHG